MCGCCMCAINNGCRYYIEPSPTRFDEQLDAASYENINYVCHRHIFLSMLHCPLPGRVKHHVQVVGCERMNTFTS